VADNTTSGPGFGGGGIASFGRLFIADTTVANNNAGPRRGGGIYSPGAVTIINTTIRGNIANDGGGGIYISDAAGSVTIIGSTIADNVAAESHGGGLRSESSAVVIVNSTFADNKSFSGFGGGLYVAGGIVSNATIANNFSQGGGRALAAGSALALHNTIVSGPSDFASSACLGRVTSLDNNLFFDPACAVAVLPHDSIGDPRLGTFIDNGVPGRGFVPLLPGSPALNAADNAACLPTDQLGRRRTKKGCDIGAIEGTRQ
jgi:parallel beta-helix repeat protein/predicted outer membrane repeat protein